MDNTQDDLKIQELKASLLPVLFIKEVNVIFTKVDGTERTMRCTLVPAKLPVIVEDPEKPKKERKQNPDVLPVFDLDKNEWRSFRWSSVKSYDIIN